MIKKLIFTTFLTSFLLVNQNINYSKKDENIALKAPNIHNQKDFSGQTLTIYNCADYINEDLIDEFEKIYKCEVDYYTYDTNETMYNQLTLQSEGYYDLVCTSEYMIQRLVREGLVEPIDIKTECPVYNEYAASLPRKKLASLYVDTDEDGTKDSSLDNYAIGYMWGTLGIIYDPFCSDTIREDVKSWDVFWNEKYSKTISIKNSMRDTFVVGLMHAFKGNDITKQEDILTPARNVFLEELKNAKTEEEKEIARNKYNKIIQDLFDLIITQDDYSEILEIVKKELISLKDNIYGLEVDSGKNDIVDGKIKMNLAWSGDAVYSIKEAYDVQGKVLEYYIPEDGSNVWYDGWSLPNKSNRELAIKFIEFISLPENAAANMDYIGYTSFISGDEVFDLASYWYGASQFDENAEYYSEYTDEDGCFYRANTVIYNNKYYECIADTQGNLPTDSNYWVEKTKEELGILDKAYDLNYLFKENMSEGKEAIIYPYKDALNRLETQYPSIDTVARCAIMNDFEEANADVVAMWSQVRTDTRMLPYYIFISCSFAFVVLFFTISSVKKAHSTKNKRKLEKLK